MGRAAIEVVLPQMQPALRTVRGKGGGLGLFRGMVDWARSTGTKVMSTCPFANSMFERDADSRDVLA